MCAHQVRRYLERQWTKILAGRVSVQDFIFAKEVRLGTYKCGISFLSRANRPMLPVHL